MANNAYNLCKILRRHNSDAHLILNPFDNFVMSHPIWEDCNFDLKTEILMASGRSDRILREEIAELGWKPPDWVHVVNVEGWRAIRGKKRLAHGLASRPGLTLNALRRAGLSKPAISHALAYLPFIGDISEFDFIAAYGLETVLANLSGAPYVAIPYGADVTVVPFEKNLRASMQRVSYAQARRILPGDPDFIGCLHKLGLSDRWTYFPCPIDIEKYRRYSTSDLPDTCKPAKFVFFMPSRQDFYWKGTDKAVRAFLRLSKQRDDVSLIMPGWGEDTPRALQMIREANATEQVTLLSYAMSKTRLIEFHNMADVVLDQFAFGSYGTSTLEAMACEKPVIGHIDADKYRTHLRQLPPNLQANTEQEIFDKMKWAAENPDRLRVLGRESREWVVNNHYTAPIRTLKEIVDPDR
jgi:glycosyltransferase involved in cell wall biosynthesis